MHGVTFKKLVKKKQIGKVAGDKCNKNTAAVQATPQSTTRHKDKE
jgi:hypothetical protein